MLDSTKKLLRSAAMHEVAEWYSKVYLPSGVRFSEIRAEINYLCRLVEKVVMPPPGVHTSLPAPTAEDVEAAVKEALAEYAAKELETL